MKNTTPNTIKVSIDNPCSLSYKKLDAIDETCSFCSVCDQFVYDFDKLPPEDFLSAYVANKGNVCIKKTEKKLVPISPKKPKSWTHQLKYWAMSFLAMIGISSCSFFDNEEEREFEIMGKMQMQLTVWDSLSNELHRLSNINLTAEDSAKIEDYLTEIQSQTGNPSQIRAWINSLSQKTINPTNQN